MTTTDRYRSSRGPTHAHQDASPQWDPSPPAPVGTSPFEAATVGLASRTVRKRTLLELSHHIERLALTADSPPIVLATVQHQSNFRGGTRDTYAAIEWTIVVLGPDTAAALIAREQQAPPRPRRTSTTSGASIRS